MNNSAIVIVCKDDVVFSVEGEDVILTAQDVLIFDPLEMHSLKAITEVDLVVVKIN